jgi:hypothetical protein
MWSGEVQLLDDLLTTPSFSNSANSAFAAAGIYWKQVSPQSQ